VVALDASGGVFRAHVSPGQATPLSIVNVSSSGLFPTVAYNPNISRFAFTFWRTLSDGNRVNAQTFPISCTSASCSGLGAVKEVLSGPGLGFTFLGWPVVAPANVRFDLVVSSDKNFQKGLSSASVDADGNTVGGVINVFASPCGGVSTVATAVSTSFGTATFGFFAPCGSADQQVGAMLQGMRLDSFGGQPAFSPISD
jgi:hypothetical protein